MSNIVKDDEGVYRWVYEFSLFRNPTILFTVLKIFLGILVGLIVFMLILLIPDLVEGYADLSDVLSTLRLGGILALVFIGLTVVGYVVYAIMQGGKYCVVFTMYEEGIEHRQLPKQFKKVQVVSGLNILAGLATGNLSQMGMGILTATHDKTTSTFEAVRSIKGSRALRVIKVNEPFAKNQVYVNKEDYDFVFSYIAERCPNAKVKG